MAKYQVTTDDGTFEVETEDSASSQATQDNSAMDLAIGGLPGGFASGIEPQDSPAIITSLLSGVSQGALRNIAEQPMLSAMGGPAVANFQNSAKGAVDLANLIPGVNLENTYQGSGVFPEASTAKGKIAQTALESLIPMASQTFLSKIKNAPKAGEIETKLSELESNAAFQQKLVEGSKKAEAGRIINEYDLEIGRKKQDLVGIQRSMLSARQNAKTSVETFRAQATNLDNVASQEGHNLTIKMREAYPKYASTLSNEFSGEFQKASKGVELPFEEYRNSIEKVAFKNRLYERLEMAPESMSPEEKKVLSYIDRIRNMEGVERVKLSDIDQEISGIISPARGKQWSSGQHILSDLREAFMDVAGEYSDAMRVVRAKFKPKLQFKNRMYEAIDPFNKSGNLDTTKGTSYFKSIAQGRGLPDDNIFLTRIEEELGTGYLGNLKKIQGDIQNTEAQTKGVIDGSRDIIQSLTQKKFQINDFIKNVESEKLKKVESVSKEFDLTAFRKQAKAVDTKKELEELLAKAEKVDFPRKIVRAIVKESIAQLKKNVKPF